LKFTQSHKQFVFLVLLLSNAFFSIAQDSKLDSIKGLLSESNGTAKVDLLITIDQLILQTGADSIDYYINETMELATELDYAKGLAYGNFWSGRAKTTIEDHGSAIEFYTLCTEQFVEIDSFYLSGSYIMLGYSYGLIGLLDEALDSHLKSVEIAKKLDDNRNMSSALTATSLTYQKYGDMEKALEYSKESLKYAEEMGHTTALVRAHNNHGLLLLEMDQDLESLDYLLPALDSAIKRSSLLDIEVCYASLAYAYNKLDSPEVSITYSEKALEVGTASTPLHNLDNIYLSLGTSYNLLNRNIEAEKYALLSYDLNKAKNDYAELANSIPLLIGIYEERKDFVTALRLQKELAAVTDSINSSDESREFGKIEAQYQFKQQQEINEVNRQLEEQKEIRIRNRNYLIAFSIVALLVIILIFSRISSQKLKKKNELIFHQNEQLKELDQAKSSFFANISHEFRTPLTLILNPVRNAKTKTDNADVKRELSLVEKYATKLLQMVNQILDLSKLEAGKMSKSSKVGDLARLIQIISSSYDSHAASRLIEYRILIEPESIITNFNADHIEKILNNILSNAFKFTERGGKITLLVKLVKNNKAKSDSIGEASDEFSCEIIVRDTGVGISDKAIPHIFDRFYQEEATSTRNYEGTGIGLSLVKELVDLYEGTVNVKSETGWGTEISISLPLDHVYTEHGKALATDEVPRQSQVTAPDLVIKTAKINVDKSIPESESTKNIVLIVEDNNDLRQHIGQGLQHNYEVLEAVNGLEGFDRALETIPDLIISDVMMPRMDGLELVEQLKNDQKTSHIPVILLTAKSSIEDKISGLKTGADEYLAKPFNQEELLIRVENLIQIRADLQKQFSSGVAFKAMANLPSLDDVFFTKAKAAVEEHIDDEHFSVEALAGELAMSRVQFHRKIKALTNQSTTHFIRTIRLERAQQLLRQGNYNVTEVAYMVGFSSQSYFTKSYQKHFNESPSEVQK
jgi:signal transduction histidine kinase/DNA-binding response OmpR family regulator